jgi:RsiW-degrading membrane proteinase PrsW (M82 family)
MNIVLGVILSVLFGVIPMALLAVILTLFDRYEKEPPWLLAGVFMWGAIVAAGAAFVLNTIFGVSVFIVSGSEGLANVGAAVLSAPFVEETVKGLAVVAVYLYFRSEFDSVLDGVVYGSLVGFGFAAAENINYIFTGFLEQGTSGLFTLVFVRVLLIPFLHATLTSLTGIGLAVGRLNRGGLRVAGPLLGYGAAIGLHAFHNLLASVPDPLLCLLGKVIDWTGFIGMFVFVLYLVWREGNVLREQLREEVALGYLTEPQYKTAASIGGQLAARWGALTAGHWRAAADFYDLLGELAFKKYQLARLGPEREPEAQGLIDRLRRQIASARSQSPL